MYFDTTGHLNYANNNFMGVQYSTNGGVTWSSSTNLVSPNDYQLCLPLNIKPLSDGRLVAMAGLVAKGVTPVAPNVQKDMFIGTFSGNQLTWGAPIPLMTTAQGICEESDFVELPNGNLFFMHRLQHYDANGNYVSQSRNQSHVTKVGNTFVPQTPTVPFSGGQGFPASCSPARAYFWTCATKGPIGRTTMARPGTTSWWVASSLTRITIPKPCKRRTARSW